MVHTYAQGFPGATNGSLVCEYRLRHTSMAAES
jgi:hypothetical protein